MTSASVSVNLGGAAEPMPYTIGAKAFTYRPIDQKIKSKLEGVLTEKSRKALKQDKDFMSDDEYQLAWGAFHDRVVTGAYTFGSKLFKAWFSSVDGMAHLLEACTGVKTVEWENMVQTHPNDVAELIGLIMDISFPNWRAALTEA